MIRRIVVGSDGSRHSRRAVLFAAQLAQQLRAEVLLVHASGNVAPARTTANQYLLNMAQNGSNGSADSEDSLEQLVRTTWTRPLISARVPWGVDVRYGWAPDVLARAADEVGAELIVVGAASYEPTANVDGLSVSAALARRSSVPVIVVPDETESVELHSVGITTAATT